MYMRPARENSTDQAGSIRHLVWNLEKAIACTKRKSKEVHVNRGGEGIALDKINLVIDFEGFSLSGAPSMSTSKLTIDVLQKHYPERMHRAYLVHPPGIFRIFWNMVKPFVDPVTRDKTIFVSKGDDLSRYVDDLGQLEDIAGGTAPASAFDSHTYLNIPKFDVAFGEHV